MQPAHSAYCLRQIKVVPCGLDDDFGGLVDINVQQWSTVRKPE